MVVGRKKRHYPNMLKVARQNAGYDQRRVAGMIGCNNSIALSGWETGKTMPSGANLIKLCVLYGKSPRALYPQYCDEIERMLQEAD